MYMESDKPAFMCEAKIYANHALTPLDEYVLPQIRREELGQSVEGDTRHRARKRDRGFHVQERFVEAKAGDVLTIRAVVHGGVYQKASILLVADGVGVKALHLQESLFCEMNLPRRPYFGPPGSSGALKPNEVRHTVRAEHLNPTDVRQASRSEAGDDDDNDGYNPGVGSLMAVFSSRPSKHQTYTENGLDGGPGSWRDKSGTTRRSGILPKLGLTWSNSAPLKWLDPEFPSGTQNPERISTQPGSRPWAKFIFYCRTLEQIQSAGCIRRDRKKILEYVDRSCHEPSALEEGRAPPQTTGTFSASARGALIATADSTGIKSENDDIRTDDNIVRQSAENVQSTESGDWATEAATRSLSEFSLGDHPMRRRSDFRSRGKLPATTLFVTPDPDLDDLPADDSSVSSSAYDDETMTIPARLGVATTIHTEQSAGDAGDSLLGTFPRRTSAASDRAPRTPNADTHQPPAEVRGGDFKTKSVRSVASGSASASRQSNNNVDTSCTSISKKRRAELEAHTEDLKAQNLAKRQKRLDLERRKVQLEEESEAAKVAALEKRKRDLEEESRREDDLIRKIEAELADLA